VDLREARTIDLLRSAVFELAAARDIATVTTTELARSAGISRRTVYNHGSNPQELLFRYLSAELTEIREGLETYYADRSSRESFDVGIRAVLEHVDRQRAIYERAVTDEAGPAWHHMLTVHFTVSLSHFLSWYHPSIEWPGQVSGTQRAEVMDVAAQSIAHGIVGAIEGWLRLPDSTSPDVCFRIISEVAPEWMYSN
jgi:AcrR family transcriptional regulator